MKRRPIGSRRTFFLVLKYFKYRIKLRRQEQKPIIMKIWKVQVTISKWENRKAYTVRKAAVKNLLKENS